MSKSRYYNRTNTCDICEKDLIRDPCPRREYNKHGYWSGKWTCNACHHTFNKHGTYDKEEILKKKREILENRRNNALNRKCSRCGKVTYITPYGYPEWYKSGEYYICKECYDLERRDVPSSWYNIVKYINTDRLKIIDIYNFHNLNNNEKGLIIEQLVCRTIDAINRNIKEDNLKSKTDTLCHRIYGYIEIKGSSLHENYNWVFGALENREYDTLIIVGMDNKEPWNNVEIVYIIPYGAEELFGLSSININKENDYKWRKFRVDEKPYNDTWQKMKKERYILKELWT